MHILGPLILPGYLLQLRISSFYLILAIFLETYRPRVYFFDQTIVLLFLWCLLFLVISLWFINLIEIVLRSHRNLIDPHLVI